MLGGGCADHSLGEGGGACSMHGALGSSSAQPNGSGGAVWDICTLRENALL